MYTSYFLDCSRGVHWPFVVVRLFTVSLLVSGVGLHAGDKIDPKAQKTTINNAAKAMDAAEKILEQYGTISISAPLLVPAPTTGSPFKFDLENVTPDVNFDRARSERQTRQAIVDESALVMAIAGKAQFSPEEAVARTMALQGAATADSLRSEALTLKRAAIANRRAAAIAGIATTATPEERQKQTDEATAKAQDEEAALLLDHAGKVAAPTPVAGFAPTVGNNLSSQAKTDGLSAAGPVKDKISNLDDTSIPTRSALVTAAGDTATQAMLSVLGDPVQYLAGTGKQVLFGVAMVTVDPGWKTKEDFLAEVAVQVRYATKNATKKSNAAVAPKSDPAPTGEEAVTEANVDMAIRSNTGPIGEASEWTLCDDCSPLVVAVSPMTDVQATEFDSGVRRRVELSLALAASLAQSGQKAEAAVFSSFAKQLQSDINLTTVQSSVTAYSLSGGIFGFRVGPKIGAKIAPGGKQTKSRVVQQLERVTFPVLVMVVMENTDLRHLSEISTGGVAISFSQTNRWLTQTHFLGRLNWGAFRGRQHETDIANCLYTLAQAQDGLNGLYPKSVGERQVASQLTARARNISYLLGGSDHTQEVPESALEAAKRCPKPAITQILPATLALNAEKVLERDANLVLLGTDLDGEWKVSLLSGTVVAGLAVQPGKTSLVVKIPKGTALTAGMEALRLTRAASASCSEVTLWSPAIQVTSTAKKPEIKQVIPATFELDGDKALPGDVNLVIVGTDLDDGWTVSWLNEIDPTAASAPTVVPSGSGKSSILVKLPKGSKPVAGSNALKLEREDLETKKKITLWTSPVTVAVKKPTGVAANDAEKNITLTRRVTGKAGEILEDTYSAPVANAAHLVSLVERDKPVVVVPQAK